MPDTPLRVAVCSASHIVREGLVGVIGQLGEQALVVSASGPTDGPVAEHDVTIQDLHDLPRSSGVPRSLWPGAAVVGLVYDGTRPTRPDAPVISLAATPDELWTVLQRASGRSAPAEGAGVRRLPSGLTERELQILTAIGRGLSNLEIAEELYVSPNTVKTYIRSAYRKIGVATRTQALGWAFEHGLAGRTGSS